jgi:RES domain-containing protein
MWIELPAQTPLYRASRAGDSWANVLQGYGAFFSAGGRYNRVDQQTIYTSRDVRAALAEFAWHAGLNFSTALGKADDLNYPLKTTGKLWRFQFTTPITLVDITAAACAHHFGFPAHAAFNPHPDRYERCQLIADRLRNWVKPPPPNQRPEGLEAPSIRTSPAGAYSPRQIVLFVRPSPEVVPESLEARATLLADWDIELEFTTPTGQAVSAIDQLVGWLTPRFRLSGNPNSVPKCPLRPGGKAIPVGKWHPLDIRYSPH